MTTARQSLHVVVCSLIAIEATTKLQWGPRVWGRPVDAPKGELKATQQMTKGYDADGVVVISVTL